MLTKIPFPVYSIVSILFFLCVNHFDGFVQDAVLYTLQAMHYISPDRFIGDIAFMYGNQDDYTLFSPIYSFFIKHFSIDNAALILCILIHVFFAFSASLFVWRWTKYLHCDWLSIVVVLAFFALYSYGEERNEFVFTIKTIEAFSVPRTLSAGFGFLGLAFLKDKWKSLPFFILGTLIHPITAGWCLPLWCCFCYPKMRIPVLVFSILFPLTIFIGREPWAVCPKEWIEISFGNGFGEQLKNMFLYLAFFIMVAAKLKCPLVMKKFLYSFCFVLSIAIYWYVVELSFHHVFLHQVQIFRIQWMCQMLAVFISIWQVSRIYLTKFCKKNALEFSQKIFIVSLLVIWIDSSFVLALIGLFFFYQWCKKCNAIFVYRIVALIVGSCCLLLLFYWLHGFVPCPEPEWSYADKLLVMKHLFAGVAAIVLAVSVSTPRFKFWGCCILLLNVCMVMSAWEILPKENFGIAYIMAVLLLMMFYMQYKNKWMQNVMFVGLSVAMICFVAVNYDHRPSVQKNREKAMNQFLDSPPFPYIANRGKILFSVFDYAENIPRLRFLSGGYYDYQIDVGTMFSKRYKFATDSHKRNILYGMDKSLDSLWMRIDEFEKKQKIEERLLDNDSLQNCVKRLCQENEISHLVSDKRLPLVASDSLILWYKEEKIWLYPCM